MVKLIRPQYIPSRLYHFTLKKNVKPILRLGLKPSRDRLGNEPYVWMNKELHRVQDRVTLQINTSNLNKSKFRTFNKKLVYLYKDAIRPTNISVVR